MPAAQWPLHNERPVIEVVLSLAGGQDLVRHLVADTGAGSRQSVFQLVIDETTCLRCGGMPMGRVQLGGAYAGLFPVYLVPVRLPTLNFDEPVAVVGVAQVPQGFGGIAGFKFLRRFHFGNFGNPDQFGLELLPVP